MGLKKKGRKEKCSGGCLEKIKEAREGKIGEKGTRKGVRNVKERRDIFVNDITSK